MTADLDLRRALRRLAAALAIFLFPATAAADISGKASAIDGDTIEIRGTRIVLHGIDAPEIDQICQAKRGLTYKCGVVSREALSSLLSGRTVTCKGNAHDGEGRLVAKCFIEWLDIGAQMVLIGRALADRSQGADYVRMENVAKSLREGMWRGTFLPPWEWRRQQAGGAKNAP